jgi:hypothetical protein
MRAEISAASAPPVRSTIPADVMAAPRIGVSKATMPPTFSRSPWSASMKPWLSTMPVEAEKKARMQETSGSMALTSSGVFQVRPSTPLAWAWSQIAWSFGNWSSDVATISLPQASTFTPRSAQ